MNEPPSNRRPGDPNPRPGSSEVNRIVDGSNMAAGHGAPRDYGIARAIYAIVEWRRRRKNQSR